MSAETAWAILQQRDGQLHRGSWEAIAAAQQLAAGIDGGSVGAVLIGHQMDRLAQEIVSRGVVQRLLVLDAPTLEPYTPGGFRSALAPVLAGGAPDWLVFPHTYQTVDWMPRLAQQLGAAVLPEVVGIRREEGGLLFQRPVLGGKLQATIRRRDTGLTCVSVQSGAFPADGLTAGQSTSLDRLDLATAPQPDREILGVEDAASETVDLSQAAVIVAAGRGVGGVDKMGPLRELAAALGGELGASRPVIDNGWLPRDRQIGSSGQTVAPKLYIAAGISGAIQHLVGMKGSSVVVAINKDAGAPIFALAKYGLVGDLHEIVPAIVEALRQARSEG